MRNNLSLHSPLSFSFTPAELSSSYFPFNQHYQSLTISPVHHSSTFSHKFNNLPQFSRPRVSVISDLTYLPTLLSSSITRFSSLLRLRISRVSALTFLNSLLSASITQFPRLFPASRNILLSHFF